jgi:hypothetical protein
LRKKILRHCLWRWAVGALLSAQKIALGKDRFFLFFRGFLFQSLLSVEHPAKALPSV